MAKIMDESAVNRAVARVAHEIMEHNKGADNVVLVGIQRRGVSLAKIRMMEILPSNGFSTVFCVFSANAICMLPTHPMMSAAVVSNFVVFMLFVLLFLV